ncbi:glucosamine kinase [Mycolicibacterium brisbanense]|uniref:Glucosamine kinase n=1 Tax=Mycolicibacterium brisbanense TaxID=146020 RepID=A0A117I5S0_9MYCO|nr:glucosamine kinase [Mycolicibacterium brisbanense]MCV7156149.1 aminoglycoside phosphotransferase [Mycolicibacterium brisbanense]GAS88907.1 aminoglycoside phosphotransferase [Mycolicibacterium brisbanense]
MIELDHLDLADGRRLVVADGPSGLTAVPTVRDPDGSWRRAAPGDGVAEAMLDVLADGSSEYGNFTVVSWTQCRAAGERPIAVDQTNESVIVGGEAIVKWATHLDDGPHPAPGRITALRAAGFTGMPTPWGLVTWRSPRGEQTLVATIDEYLPGAVDGWTWAVDLVTAAAQDAAARPRLIAAAGAVGDLVADMHTALAATASVADAAQARGWRDAAFETLETAVALSTSVSGDILRERRDDIEAMLDGLGSLAGIPVFEGHGDLHVGQVLLSDGRFVITDFDGNPVLSAEARMQPIPATFDVAGMVQSLAHVAIVAQKYTALEPHALTDVSNLVRRTFLDAYQASAPRYDPAPLRALRLQQVLREIIYAAKHLPRWMYVPDAALPALLDEGITA